MIYDGGELNEIDPTTSSDDLGDNPLAFAAFCVLLVVVVIAQVFLFKKMKWF